MAICIIVFKDNQSAQLLIASLAEAKAAITQIALIEPTSSKIFGQVETKGKNDESPSMLNQLKATKMRDVEILNPQISQQKRQRSMAMWLMPFGFIAGITFEGMTNLNTFSLFRLGALGDLILGGILGLISGFLGSFFASRSVNPYKKDIEKLKKLNEKGKWLLLLETSFEAEPPWIQINQSKPTEIVRFSEL